MRALVFLILFVGAFSANAHEYYFAFAEVEYNDVTQKFESTLIVSTHDLEIILERDSIMTREISEIDADQSEYCTLEKYLNEHFTIETNNHKCVFKLIGIESNLNGTTNFYFESEEINIGLSIDFRFDLMMDHFKEQNNKLTFYFRGKNYTYSFLAAQTKQTFKSEIE